MFGIDHIDEVKNDDAAQIAQSQLSCNGVSGFQIGLENSVIERPSVNEASCIDIDGSSWLRSGQR